MRGVVLMVLFALAAIDPVAVQAEIRMTVEGNTLQFDTDAISTTDGADPTISAQDPRLFGELVMENPSIDTVVVAGAGGVTWAAYEIANKITEFGLTTVARNNCASACTILFLAGKERRLEAGARLGFHRSSRSAKSQREYYAKNKDEMGWIDEFAFANSAFESGQMAAREFISYAVKCVSACNFDPLRRGIGIQFCPP